MIVDRDDGVEGRPLGEGDDGLGGGLRQQVTRNAQSPITLQAPAAARRATTSGAERRGRVEKVLRPVRRRGQQKKQAGHPASCC